MSNQFATNYTIPSSTNTFKCFWKLTRVMKAAGYVTMASCNGSTIDSSGTQANDLWGGNANPQLDTYSNISTTATTGQTSANISSGGTLTVTSTTNFPLSGTLYVATSLGWQNVAYTNVSGSTFTGCTGGTGNPSFGSVVSGSTTMGMDQVSGWIVMSGPSTIRVPLTSAPTGTFIRNENITQSGSSATGTLVGYVWDSVSASGWAVIMPQTGTLNNTGTITGASSGATMVPPGTLTTAIGAGQTVANISSGGTLTVTSTTGFAGSGTITVSTSLGWQNIAYTGTSGSTFTGCTGGTGAPISGNLVAAGSSSQGTLVATYVREFMFWKDTGLVNATVYYICADKVGEITQLFSTIAGYTGYGAQGRISTTTNSGSGALSSFGTLIVNSVTGFPNSGSISVSTSSGQSTITYTGTQTSPSIAFTGCTGGSGNIINGSAVSSNGVAPSTAPNGLAVSVGPGMGGLNNGLNTISPKGIVCRGTQGATTAISLFAITNSFQNNAQIACVNATPSAGVAADGSFYLVLSSVYQTNSVFGLHFGALDSSEPGDVDPYYWYGSIGITYSAWNNTIANSYVGSTGAFSANQLFNGVSTVGYFLGYQSRGNTVTSRDVIGYYGGACLFSGISNVSGFVSGYPGGTNVVRVSNTPAAIKPLTRESVKIGNTANTGIVNSVSQMKGSARWFMAAGTGNIYDTMDNKTWLCVCSYTPATPTLSLWLGPYDGTTSPIQ